jgi:hypothetical protein
LNAFSFVVGNFIILHLNERARVLAESQNALWPPAFASTHKKVSVWRVKNEYAACRAKAIRIMVLHGVFI